MNYIPLREAQYLTPRGVAMLLVEIGYWSILDYTEFCEKNGWSVF